MSEWTDRQDEMLDELYAKVPDVGCKGLCQSECTIITGGRREAQRMAEAGYPIPTSYRPGLMAAHRANHVNRCAALDADGRCQVYEIRPLICRLWGAVEGMRCPHGCEPEGGRLRNNEAAQLLKRAKRI